MTSLALPRALAPWAPWLATFPAEVALALGPLVQRLSASIGPMTGRPRSGDGEPDGFDGITRRGVYERLLASEWLVAELEPDEFLRRAVASEHSFLRLERRDPTRARTTVVLFDTGPAQLGSPRIAHLAALVAFARRAEMGGASLAWGVLHDAASALATELRPEALRALLGARTAMAPSAEDVASWRERAARGEWADVWIVGGERAVAHRWSRASAIELADVIAPGARELVATVRGAHGRSTETRLPLPPGPACVRLVRDPFAEERPTVPIVAGPDAEGALRRTKLVPSSNLVFSPRGDRLFARSEHGDVISFPIPHSARGGVGRPKVPPHGSGPVLAAGAVGRDAVIITQRSDGADVAWIGGRQPRALETFRTTTEPPRLAISGGLGNVVSWGGRLLVGADGDALYAMFSGDRSIHLVATEAVGLVATTMRMAYVARARDREWEIVIEGPGTDRTRLPVGSDWVGGVCFAERPNGDWIAAVAIEPERWKLFGARATNVEWRTSERVVGLVTGNVFPAGSLGHALVTIDADGRTLLARHSNGARRLAVAGEPIRHAAVFASNARLAYFTEGGSLVVSGPPYQSALARFLCVAS